MKYLIHYNTQISTNYEITSYQLVMLVIVMSSVETLVISYEEGFFKKENNKAYF